MVVDDASPDMVVAAVAAIHRSPYAVLFPPRFADSGERFHAEFPDLRVVVFRGISAAASFPQAGGTFCVYGTDRETDIFRAGLFSGAMAGIVRSGDGSESEPQRSHVLWRDELSSERERSLFSTGLAVTAPGSTAVFAAEAGQLPASDRIASMEMYGAGGGYLESSRGIPIVLLGWVHPSLTANEVIVILDDSHWALAAAAVRLAASGTASALIPSKPLIFSGRLADNRTVRHLRKYAGAVTPG